MAEFIVKIHANSIDAVDAILNKAIDNRSASGVDGFYILAEDKKSLAHLHGEPHMWVERDEANRISKTLSRPVSERRA